MPAVSTAMKLQTMMKRREDRPRDADRTFTPAQSLCHALSSHEVFEMQTEMLSNMQRGSSPTDRKKAEDLKRLADPHRMCGVG